MIHSARYIVVEAESVPRIILLNTPVALFNRVVVQNGVFGNFEAKLPKRRLERSRFESGGRLRVELKERLWR